MTEKGTYNLRSGGHIDRGNLDPLMSTDTQECPLNQEAALSKEQPDFQAGDSILRAEIQTEGHVVSSQGDTFGNNPVGSVAMEITRTSVVGDDLPSQRYSVITPGDRCRNEASTDKQCEMASDAHDEAAYDRAPNSEVTQSSGALSNPKSSRMGNLRTDTHDGFSVTPPQQSYSNERRQSAPERISKGEDLERNESSARGITRPIEIRERYPEAHNLGDGQSRSYCDHLDLEQNRNITKPRTSPNFDNGMGVLRQPMTGFEQRNNIPFQPANDHQQIYVGGNVPIRYPRGNFAEWNSLAGSEPRPRLPSFDGKGDWRSFRVKFSLLADRYHWDGPTQLSHLVSCLQEDAMFFMSRLAPQIRANLGQLMDALERRFGDHVLPETHRLSLQNLKKNAQESLQEYVARVQTLVSRAYPGLEGSELFNSMTIDHLVSGLQDPNLVYDVKTKRPTTIQEALDMIAWHECCRGAARKRNVRNVAEADNNDIRRTSGHRYVTEERLQHFGRDLKESLVHSVNEAVKNQVQSLMAGQAGSQQQAQQRKWRNLEGDQGKCFNCKKPGHYMRNCPAIRTGERPGPKDNSLN